MKRVATISLVLAALGTATQARANLVDLTPGGVSSEQFVNLPAFEDLQHSLFFDDAAYGTFYTLQCTPESCAAGLEFLDGWVSNYGVLDGGTHFWTGLFNTSPTSETNTWWNFTGTDFWLTEILVWGCTDDSCQNGSRYHAYAPNYDERFVSAARETLALPDGYMIKDIAFYGLDSAHVPEYGSTLAFLCVGIASLWALDRRRWHFSR
jgi:hypothetical protein